MNCPYLKNDDFLFLDLIPNKLEVIKTSLPYFLQNQHPSIEGKD